jgi:hypothetical protein
MAFAHCDVVPDVGFPENLQMIGQSPFASCPSLSFVWLPDSLLEAGTNAFGNSGVLFILRKCTFAALWEAQFARWPMA